MTTTVQHLEKRGHCNKWFDRQAAQRTKTLYASQFGNQLPVTKRIVRELNIKHVMWIEDQDKTPIAACMLTEINPVFFRISGLAVDSVHHRKGLGTALVCEIEKVLPNHTTVELGVDTGKENTEWLREWYGRMGYKECDFTYDEITMRKRIECCE
jgi:hypothetical protein